MTGNHEQDAEEESSASEGEAERVGNLLEKHQTHRMSGMLQKL